MESKETAKYFRVHKDSYQGWERNEITPHITNRKRVIDFLEYNYWNDGTGSLSNKCLLYRIEYGLTSEKFVQKVNVRQITISRQKSKKIR